MKSETIAGRSKERPVFSPELSVVIGAVDAERSIRGCLASVVEACRGIDTQVIVVASSGDKTSAIAAEFPDAQIIDMPRDTLVPRLWSEGITRARGDKIALITGHCEVDPRWARELTAAIDAGAAGAGGPIALASDATTLDSAIYFIRYSAFFPLTVAGDIRVREIAGDNAMYAKGVLDSHESSFNDGFWEIEFHERLRADGGYLVISESAPVVFGRSFSLPVIGTHRLMHGRHFSAWRARGRKAYALRIILGGLLVPFILFARTAGRVWRVKEHRRRFLAASPLVFLLAWCWAIGEIIGGFDALTASRDKHLQLGSNAHRS
jgi:glycosyltransferase involved in cell wall biosynthesis